MEIAIIGWYGTETIGDRAILAGIFRVLSKCMGDFHIRLGSLYPFYTERTLIEDFSFYQYCAGNSKLRITIFDSQNPFKIAENIRKSDFLAIGGGPLMDLREMHMLDYAFTFARKHNVRTILLGCGWGPLKKEESINIAQRLIDGSVLTIFRDSISVDQYKKLSHKQKEDVYGLIDPAFFACLAFLEKYKKVHRSGDFIACNYRDVALEGDNYANKSIPNELFALITKSIQEKEKIPVKLVPMHYFFIGGDDRMILSKVKEIMASDSVEVVRETQSLENTMKLYYDAKACVGMRFHSVVLQTMLNGKNYVVDYTDKRNGKIISMIKQLHLEQEFNGRYCSLYSDKIKYNFDDSKKIEIESNMISTYENKYIELIRDLL